MSPSLAHTWLKAARFGLRYSLRMEKPGEGMSSSLKRKGERERERERENAVVVLHAFVGDGLVDHEWTNRTRTNSHKSC